MYTNSFQQTQYVFSCVQYMVVYFAFTFQLFLTININVVLVGSLVKIAFCVYENLLEFLQKVAQQYKTKTICLSITQPIFCFLLQQKPRHAVLKAAIMIITTYHHNAFFNFWRSSTRSIICEGPWNKAQFSWKNFFSDCKCP